MKKYWQMYVRAPWEKKTLLMAAAIAALPILASLIFSSSTPTPREKSRAPDVDTFIPKGFVLVPIEVQNYEALDSILGNFGVVDLFQSVSVDNPAQRLVARNVRILRAPQNPSHFAILVQEAEVGGVLKNGGGFTVIVKRPEKSGTEFVNTKATPRRAIVYDKESE